MMSNYAKSSELNPTQLRRLTERLSRLSEADWQDLHALSLLLDKAQDQEEKGQIAKAVIEIIEAKPVVARPMNMRESLPTELQKWGGFVGKKIRKLRQDRGWTQFELAKRSCLPQSHICRLEKGKHSPSFLTIDRLAEALGVAVGELDPARE
jgi:ribosome-binding protein aMBF1 (putative translation factor)